MDEKNVLIPVSEEEMAKVAGGEGEPEAIHVGPGGGQEYQCPSCHYTDFYMTGSDAQWVYLRCKRCNFICKAPQ